MAAPSNADRRLTFQNSIELCKKNNLDVSKANPAYGFLRLETPINDGQSTYSFPLLQNQTYNGVNQSPTEQRIALQDNFVVGSKGFFIQVWQKSTNQPVTSLLRHISRYNATVQNSGNYLAWAFNIAAGAATTAIPWLNDEWWNSCYMRYSMDYGVVIPRYDMLQHFCVPRTQATQNGLTSGPGAPIGYPWTVDNIDGLSDGFIPMEPNIVLSGAKNTEITFINPLAMTFASLGWAFTSDYYAKLVVMYRGVLLQNTTNVK